MKKLSKTTVQIMSVSLIVGVVLLAGLITNTAARCSADESTANQIRVENLLQLQKDSLESLYLKREVALMDSLEEVNLARVQETRSATIDLKRSLEKEKYKSSELERKFRENPTLEGCTETIDQKNVEISKQSQVIDSLDTEAQQWCELYEAEDIKGRKKDTLISQKERTIATLSSEVTKMQAEVTSIDHKLNNTSWLKRNWKWATGSYRNWLKDYK